MAWCEYRGRLVKQFSSQWTGASTGGSRGASRSLRRELFLDGVPGLGIDDRRMLSLVAFSFVSNPTYIEWVAEQGIDVAATEGAATKHSLAYSLANFRHETDAIGFVLDLPYGAQL